MYNYYLGVALAKMLACLPACYKGDHWIDSRLGRSDVKKEKEKRNKMLS
jgi:hypothetical protein